MYKHHPISTKLYWDATLTQWGIEAEALGEEGIFIKPRLEQILTGIRKETEGNKHFHSYLIVKDGNQFASSVIEISHALPKSQDARLKLLNINLRPSLLIIGDEDVEKFREAFFVLTYSITHAMSLIFKEHPAKELKIYGRTPQIIELFRAILSAGQIDLSLDSMAFSVKLESRWLILSRKE